MSKRRGGSLPRVMPNRSSELRRQVNAPAHPLSGSGRVMIATPTHNESTIAPFTQSLITSIFTLQKYGITAGWQYTSNCGLIGWARNELATCFLTEGAATHLVFIDSDIEWQPDDLLRLLSHDVDIAVGAYAYRGVRDGSSAYCEPNRAPDGKVIRDPRTGLIEICAAGAGFLSIRRQALMKIMAAYPEEKINDPHSTLPASIQRWQFNFFPTIVDQHGRMLGEDVSFFARWRNIGGKVWLDPSIRLRHHGMHGYEADPMTMLAPAPQAAEAA